MGEARASTCPACVLGSRVRGHQTSQRKQQVCATRSLEGGAGAFPPESGAERERERQPATGSTYWGNPHLDWIRARVAAGGKDSRSLLCGGRRCGVDPAGCPHC